MSSFQLYTVIVYDLPFHKAECFGPVRSQTPQEALIGALQFLDPLIIGDIQPVIALQIKETEVHLCQDIPQQSEMPSPAQAQQFTVIGYNIKREETVVHYIEATHWWVAGIYWRRDIFQNNNDFHFVAAIQGLVPVTMDCTWQGLTIGPRSSDGVDIGRHFRFAMRLKARYPDAVETINKDGSAYLATSTGRLGPRIRKGKGWVNPRTKQ
ncbi:hypothetical protein [Magnetospirillum moscoviense]|uniref:hypothetical protein n=1 Tax=Magnetospirillum moscoviense TaxID=1437059 RepID=UPI000B2EA4EC|nr:hypothetical protein [Magnetospirillum moscoviense]